MTVCSHVRAWVGMMAQAAKINVIMCYMPVPYGLHPYFFSLSTVPFDQFVIVFMIVSPPSSRSLLPILSPPSTRF